MTLNTRVHVIKCENIWDVQQPHSGDICFEMSTGMTHVYNEARENFMPLMLTDLAVECAKEYTVPPNYANCRNCGAPVKGYQCEYCGTRY